MKIWDFTVSKMESLTNIPMATATQEAGADDPRTKVKPIRPSRSPDGVPEAFQPERAKRQKDTELPGMSSLTAALPKRQKAARSRGLWASFLLLVGLPTLAAIAYYFAIASNQYVSEFRFAVRSQDFTPAGTSAASTALNGAARSSVYTDNFLVIDYLQSRQAIEDLMKSLNLVEMYSNPDIDFLSRLRGEKTSENLANYWQTKVSASFDLSTGLALVRVYAFTPEDAFKISSTLVDQSERLINDITARARRDAVKFAEGDVARAEERLRTARTEVHQFRDIRQTPDAARTANGTLDLAMTLRGELASLQSQLTTLRSYMAPDAPTVKVLENRIAATKQQIASVERELGTGSNNGARANNAGSDPSVSAESGGRAANEAPAISEMLSNYEDIDLSRQFAEKYYDTTLAALELARSHAATQQTYVATYVQPTVPQASEYPQRIISILIVFLACAAIWFIGVMIFFSIRDHVA